MQMLWYIILVAVGSAIGGLARWGSSLLFVALLGKVWPFGTFFVNITGCLLLGWLSAILGKRVLAGHPAHVEELRLLIAVGFCGAYTTFSTFGVETDFLLREGWLTRGYLYVALSVLGGLLAVRLGVWLGGA